MSGGEQNPRSYGPNLHDIDKRVTLLESGQVRMQDDLKAIHGNTSKLVWILITAIVLAILKTLFKV